ncbi:MAG: HigA family addiction module antitoxin [Pseudomonadota bacterium]
MRIRREDLEQVDFSGVAESTATLPPVHPGEILLHDFMEPLGLSANALARALVVPPNRITGIINGQRSVSADSALRLARYFGTTAEFWMGLQKDYELQKARREELALIERQVSPRAA